MKPKVLDANENAFFERYGVSLQELCDDAAYSWDSIPSGSEEAAIPELNGILILFVCGFFYGINDLIKKMGPKAEILIFVPEPSVFLYYCCRYDLSGLITEERVTIVIENEGAWEKIVQKKVSVFNRKHMGTMIAPGYEDRYRLIYDRMCEPVRRVMDVEPYFGGQKCKNELYAVSELKNNYLADDFVKRIPVRDIPVIIVSAGPSLMKNMQHLNDAKGKAVIVTVDHAVKTLDANGIHTDFVAKTDPKVGTRFMSYTDAHRHRLLISAGAALDVQSEYSGRCYYFQISPVFFPEVAQKACLKKWNSGGSVATDVLDYFASSGFNTVILVGQDLAYDEQGFSHASGEKQEDNRNRFEVDGINGKKVVTRDDWLVFIQSFEKMIRLYPNTKVIDATEGGALIRGSEVMDLENAVSVYCREDYPVEQWIEQTEKCEKKYGADIGKEDLNRQRCIIERTIEKIEEALYLNVVICAVYEGRLMDSEEFSSKCARYDCLYHDIMEDDDLLFLYEYCGDQIKQYLENMSLNEEDIPIRMRGEYELFKAFKSGCREISGIILSIEEKDDKNSI